METTNDSLKKKAGTWMVIAIILFIACAVLTGLLISSSKKVSNLTTETKTLTDEKTQMISKLENLQKQYDQLGTEHKELNDMFEKEKAHVDELLKKIKTSQGSVEKYKGQVAALETRLKEYEQQIEELKSQNKSLVAENFVIKTSLDSTTTVAKGLETKNTALSETVNKGSILTVYDFFANGIKVGSKKEIPTAKGKKADKIRVCFTIGENAIAKAGNRDIYIRIADPTGNILCKGKGDDYSFMFQDKKIQYSIKQSVDYQNKPMDMCLYWDKSGDFAPGNYIVDIFADGINIATTNFVFEK